MYRKIVWCYIIVLTLLDISLNTKLSAQGKSHGNGVSVHEALMEGISLQEWDQQQGRAALLTPAPRALRFGRRALCAPHALHVTLTNVANETLHLASVAGTTPDFHASFFESKTLAPQANTTFSVVYLGRREGPVSAHLYIHTSKGLHKYPVSAVGVASQWRVWPMVGLRVPLNATLEPLLTLYNPTDTAIQVSEVYSSGAWLGLALPERGARAPRAQWTVPPHAARALVRLHVQPPHRDLLAPRAAYIRIKANMTGGGLVVAVEAAPAPAGEFLSPVQLRLRTRGSMDPPDSFFIDAGTSDGAPARLEAHVGGGCGATAAGDTPPPPLPAHLMSDKVTLNGVMADVSGVTLKLLRERMEPYQPLEAAAQLTLDFAKMWAGYEASLANGGGGGAGGAGGEAHCAGWVRVGRAALPYSLRVLPGTLTLLPNELHFVTCEREQALRPREVVARNDFPEPLRITHVEFPPEVHDMFHAESLAPLELAPGGAGAACRLRLRAARAGAALQARVTLHTNLSDYSLPLLLYEGTLRIEWEWPNSADGTLRLGALGTGSSLEVGARLHNPGPVPLCRLRLSAALPGAGAAFGLRAEHAGCVPGAGWARAALAVRAPGAEGAVRGAVLARSAHGAARAAVVLHARHGRVRALEPIMPPAAPYVWSVAPLELENSMGLRMRVLGATQPVLDPALSYVWEGDGRGAEVVEGRGAAGSLRYAPERHCEPACYTGLQLDSPAGAAWAARQHTDERTLPRDAELQRARYALFQRRHDNFTLYLRTSEVVRVLVTGTVRWAWPRLWTEDAPLNARAGLVGVGSSLALRLRAANPSRDRPLLLQPRLAAQPLDLGGAEPSGESACVGCAWSAASFQLGTWRVTRGLARAYRPPGHAEGSDSYLLLQPLAELEFTITFSPAEPADLAAYFYLRNNLTILERVLLRGRGAHPTFELGGRKPNSSAAIVVEVSACGAAGGAGRGARALAVRNTGRVPLRLRDWRVAGAACGARGFRLQPCASARLAPGESGTLHLHYGADWTRSRARADLTVSVGGGVARFPLAGLAPARLVAECAGAARAPREPELRSLALAVALLALLGAAGLGCADAERALRRHRGAREARGARAPLDLRALARAEPPGEPAPAARAPPAPPRRRRAARPPRPAERRAFERWRAAAGPERAEEAGARDAGGADDSRSSDSGEPELTEELGGGGAPRGDASSSSPDSSPPPRDSYSSLSRRAENRERDEEGASSGEDSSSPEEEECAPRTRTPPAGPPVPHASSRGSRQRRESAEARRSERKSAEGSLADIPPAGAARAPSRPHARKERTARRRGERAPSPAPRAASPRAPAAPLAAPPAPARWRAGASWSDVVSRGPAAAPHEGACGDDSGSSPRRARSPRALAPIGSDVRRRHGSHSLFYYGGAPAWTPAPGPPAAPPLPPAPLPTPEESVGPGYRSLESLWGSSVEPLAPGAAWLWGAGPGAAPGPAAAGASSADPVRPPPGFSAPRPVRPYDPFQSLASIWTPAALDWRLDTSTPPPAHAPLSASATPPLADDKFDLIGN